MGKFWFLQWRDRLVGALRKLNAGESAGAVLPHASKINGVERDVQEDSLISEVSPPFLLLINYYILLN